MLATRISFMNEVANVCEVVGADVDHVRRAVASDRRIGPSFLFPGVGYGGSCFPKDVKAMLKFAATKSYDFQILKAVESGQRAPEGAAAREDEEALRLAEGQAHRGLGPGVQAQDRRHARGAGGAADQRRCSTPARRSCAYDPEAMKVARGIFGSGVDIRRQELRRARRAPTRWRSSPSGTSSASRTSTHYHRS